MHQHWTHSRALVQEEGQGEEWKYFPDEATCSSDGFSVLPGHSWHLCLVKH